MQAISIPHQLQQQIGRFAVETQSDRELLLCFIVHRDESAFAALIARYKRMVLGVCRRVLRHLHDAEDACQNVFIVLARKAASLCHEKTIGGWLRGVARRIAMKIRKGKTRRQDRERRCGYSLQAQPASEAIVHELQMTLREEVQRLPEKLRASFVLCYLEEKSRAEVARELGWPEGTLSNRLAQGRKLIKQRLMRRGFIP